MNMLRYLVVLMALGVLSWNGFQLAQLDPDALRGQVAEVAPTRFLQVDEETIDELQTRLESQQSLSAYLYRDLSPRNFGREQLFYPDEPEQNENL